MPIARAFFVAVTFVLAGLTAAGAQEGAPESGFDPTARFPAQIHSGTCDDPGDVVFELGEGGFGLPVPDDPAATPDVAAEQVGPVEANPAVVLVAAVDASLDRLTDEGHVIDAHVAGEDPETSRFVCGIIGGFRVGDDLVFGMHEVNGSGYSGATWIQDLGDDTSRVTTFLVAPPPGAEGIGDQADAAAQAEADAELESETASEFAEIDRDTELSERNLPANVQAEALVVRDGEIVADELTLNEDIPTVVHVVNTDDENYRFLIDELASAAPLPANEAIFLEFTVPSDGIYAGRLLAANDDQELSVVPVTVVPR